MNESQRAMVAVELEHLFKEAAERRKAEGQRKGAEATNRERLTADLRSSAEQPKPRANRSETKRERPGRGGNREVYGRFAADFPDKYEA